MSFIKKTDSFGKLVGICAGHGGVYAPAQPNLQIASLSARFNQAKAALHSVLVSRQDLADAVARRRAAFDEAADKVVRIRPLVKNLGIPAEISRKMIRAINRVAITNGYPVGGKVTAPSDASESAATASGNGTSYRSDFLYRMSEFQLLIGMLKDCPQYIPPVKELSVADLSATADNMMACSMAVHNARNRFNAARAERYMVFHDPVTGVVPTARAAKAMLESILGKSSIAAREVRSVQI